MLGEILVYSISSVRYQIQYSPDAVDHIQTLRPRDQRIVIDGMDEQVTYEPAIETRNRKPMRPHPLAAWSFE